MSEKSLRLYPNYIDRPSESFAYILKSTNCQQKGHAPQLLLMQRKRSQRHTKGSQSLPLCICPECMITRGISTDNNKALKKTTVCYQLKASLNNDKYYP